MTGAYGKTTWVLNAFMAPPRDSAYAVVAVSEGADFMLYGCSSRAVEPIGRERMPSGDDAPETLAQRLEDCDLVLAMAALPRLRRQLEHTGVAVRRLGAGERRSAVLAAWRAWCGENGAVSASLPYGLPAPLAAAAVRGA